MQSLEKAQTESNAFSIATELSGDKFPSSPLGVKGIISTDMLKG